MNAPAAENSSIRPLLVVGDVDVARAIDGDAVGTRVELPGAAPGPAWQVLVQVSNWLAPSLTPQP